MKQVDLSHFKFVIIIAFVLLLFNCNKTDEQNIGNKPVVAFTASQTSVKLGSLVQFTDQSSYFPTSWAWEFGDGGTSTSQNPSHAYSSNSNYNVSLTVTNNYGSDNETKTDYITVTASGETGTVTDYDGNTYNTIKIGNQWWMAENLKTTHYADGTEIPLVEDTHYWADLNGDRGMCYFDNSSSNASAYGALYTWDAAMDGASSSEGNPSGVQGVCPDEWHLPSDGEWKQLEIHLGMTQVDADEVGYRGTNEGSKLAGNIDLWQAGELLSNAEFGISGFNILPGSTRLNGGTFNNALNQVASFWTTTKFSGIEDAWFRYLYFEYPEINRDHNDIGDGRSVRCIKD
ncbi:MAG: FISUMP domain-containing protein [Salinivirgaceae bacterium]|jgi:uncharacterized protein (TIGR02145 family)|nr:FISUMP domain-containing protein [Salinivirgaceae bacterium]